MNTILCADPVNSPVFSLNTDTRCKGRPILVLWESGNSSEDEFGSQIMSQGTTPNAYRYTGQQSDADSGLLYLRARYYEPSTGRFITQDPKKGDIKEPITFNLYVYCRNNPINLTDPSGLDSFLIFYQESKKIDFRGAAETRAANIKSQHLFNYDPAKDTIDIIKVDTIKAFEEALLSHENIVEIVYYGHADKDQLYFCCPSLKKKDVCSLPKKNVLKKAHIFLFGCDAGGNENEASIAKAFAQHFGVIAGGYREGYSVLYPARPGLNYAVTGHKSGWYNLMPWDFGPAGNFILYGPRSK